MRSSTTVPSCHSGPICPTRLSALRRMILTRLFLNFSTARRVWTALTRPLFALLLELADINLPSYILTDFMGTMLKISWMYFVLYCFPKVSLPTMLLCLGLYRCFRRYRSCMNIFFWGIVSMCLTIWEKSTSASDRGTRQQRQYI